MATITGNLVDFQATPRPGLHPVVVFRPRKPATQNAAVFFTRDIEVTPAPSGLFTVDLISSQVTTPYAEYDVLIKWLNGDNVPVGFDPLTDAAHPLIVGLIDGVIGDMLKTPVTALQVHVGEANDPRYVFWYQPSTAILRSNP